MLSLDRSRNRMPPLAHSGLDQVSLTIMLRRAFGSVLLLALSLSGAGIPTPKEHLGFAPGDDFKLADYAEISGYYQKLATLSDRIRLIDVGKTSEGKPMYMAIVSAPENLKRLEHFRELNRRLALGSATAAEAERLSNEGKVFVWIDSGLHASEVAPAQHSPELVYRMLTDESPEMIRIRRNVILLQVPVINPDGLDHIVHWYRKNVGTPNELAPLPWLYQKYAGHDNNRDWYMMNLQETRNISKLLFDEWFPQIVYNQHQSPVFPARIFVPPYAEPLNPNIPAPVMEGINLIGAAMKERFARENKPGILSYYGYDAWWNGGLRSVPAFHNMHGILTETALYSYATPKDYKLSELPERFPNGMPTKEPSVFYERPWMGGKWGVRNAIEYMLTADMAILDLASTRSYSFLHKAWELAVSNIEAGRSGKPYAYVIAMNQPDKSSAIEMLRRFRMGGVQVQRARSPFSASGKQYAMGTYIIPAGQPFRGYVMDLLEPQKYPELRTGTSGPTKRPYDVAGWTLNLQMGVAVDRADVPFEADVENVAEMKSQDPSLDHRDNSSFVATADLLSRNMKVRWAKDGTILTEGSGNFDQAAWELRTPRVALYESWTANIDAGWTQWVLDTYKVPHTIIRNGDFRKGGLRSRFDTIILSSESTNSILHGMRDGERSGGRLGRGEEIALQRPEYTGGIGVAGLAQLEGFVREGGSLIAFDAAADLPVQLFPLPLRTLIPDSTSTREDAAPTGYYSPGSILRITVDSSNPLAFGMPQEAYAFSSGGQAYDITLLPEYNRGEREVRSVAKYASRDLLASGWISGEKVVLGKHILVDARYGKGHVILFGFRPQFRGQAFGTFKFLLNAIYLGSARPL